MYSEEYVYIDISIDDPIRFSINEKIIMKFDNAGEGMPCLDCGRFCRQKCGMVVSLVQVRLTESLAKLGLCHNNSKTREHIRNMAVLVLKDIEAEL